MEEGRSRTQKKTLRIPKACTPSRSCLASGLRSRRPAPLSCASRVCLAATNAKSSVDRIAQAIARGEEAKVFRDRSVSPSYVVDVAASTKALVERGRPGLYHCVGTGYGTWLDVGREIARIMGKEGDARLVAMSVADVTLPAPRPQFAALSNEKLGRIVPIPTWQDALRRYLSRPGA